MLLEKSLRTKRRVDVWDSAAPTASISRTRGFKLFLLSSRVHARPQSTNGNSWHARPKHQRSRFGTRGGLQEQRRDRQADLYRDQLGRLIVIGNNPMFDVERSAPLSVRLWRYKAESKTERMTVFVDRCGGDDK